MEKKYYKTTYNCPLGEITLAGDGEYLTGLWLKNQKYFGSTINKHTIKKDNLDIFNYAKKWLDRYFNGKRPNISEIKIAPAGNEFRQRVWQILCEIPYGKTITYGNIAEEIAKERGIKRMSAQAIGGAVGHNPIAIIIPCHRVIGANGNITGYAGGIDTKIKLLKLEGINTDKLITL